MPAGARIEHRPAAERVGRRDRAHDEPVARGGEQRRLEAHLPQAVAERRQPRRHRPRAVMHHDAPAAQLVAQVQHRVEDLRRHDLRRGIGERIAAGDVAQRRSRRG